jgi:predicted Zn-dependent protease
MKRVRFLALCIMVLCVSLSLIYSEELVHETAKISIWYPDNWTMDSEEDNLMIADPDEEVVFVYMLVEADEVEDALDAMDKELLSMVSDLQSTGEPQEDTLNGMNCIFMEAQGNVDKVGVDIGIFMFFTPAQKVLIVMGIVQSAAYEKHEETIGQIIQGIQPL